MGDNFLKGQTENFKKGRDLAMLNAEMPELFSRPEIFETVYTVVPWDSETLTSGESLTAYPSDDGEFVTLARGHRRAGKIEGEGAVTLLAALAEADSSGIARMQITDVSSLTGMGKATVMDTEAGAGTDGEA